MKVTLATLAVLASAVLASPTGKDYEIRRAADVDASEVPTQGIVFIGQVVKDGPEVTFQGTAKEIYEQVVAINPNYSEEFGGHTLAKDYNFAAEIESHYHSKDGQSPNLAKRWPTVSVPRSSHH